MVGSVIRKRKRKWIEENMKREKGVCDEDGRERNRKRKENTFRTFQTPASFFIIII